MVAEMDYSVKVTSKRCATLLLLFVFFKKHIFTFLTLELTSHDFELNLTLQMTSNHQSNTLNGLSSQNL